MSHATREFRTSKSHPLRIADVAGPWGPGLVGVTFAPGKVQHDGATASWNRDLGMDLDAVEAWGAKGVLTLIEPHELAALSIPTLGDAVRARGLTWWHRPIPDYGTPDATFMAGWPPLSAELRGLLAEGGNVLIHCKGGLGRAGMVAARLLVEAGLDPKEAIRRVRAARSPDAIETAAQERWVAAGR